PVGVGVGPVSVAVGDFNGDGNTDLAVANFRTNDVTILLGSGSGGFTEAAGSPIAAAARPFAVAVGDFNGDGKPDLAVANDSSGIVTILLNTCNDGPPPPVTCTLSPALATNPVGTAHIVLANVTSNDVAISGASVNFSVVSGPNAGAQATKI